MARKQKGHWYKKGALKHQFCDAVTSPGGRKAALVPERCWAVYPTLWAWFQDSALQMYLILFKNTV